MCALYNHSCICETIANLHKKFNAELIGPSFFPDLIRALAPVFLQDASLGRD